jgi:hypothetical protein
VDYIANAFDRYLTVTRPFDDDMNDWRDAHVAFVVERHAAAARRVRCGPTRHRSIEPRTVASRS